MKIHMKKLKINKEKESVKVKFRNSLNMAQNIISQNKEISLESFEHPIYRVINIFALSIQARLMQPILTTHQYDIPNIRTLFIPEYQELKKNNIPFEIYESRGEIVEIDFSKDIVLSVPWHPNRFIDAISNIPREDWVYKELNHRAEYFEPFKIALIRNGFHSSTAGILNRKGTMPARKTDFESLYDWIETDGLDFYKKSDGKRICAAPSFEEAIIFEIGRLISNYR